MNKKGDILSLVFFVAILVLANVLASKSTYRIDLTEDSRYSLAISTVDVLEDLHDRVYVKVYLTGNVGANYKRLEKSVKEMLDELKIHASEGLKYEFLDPNQIEVDSLKRKKFIELSQRGLKSRIDAQMKDGKRTEKIIFPGAVVTFGAHSLPINFVKEDVSGRENFERSIAELEYEFTSTIKVLTQERKKRIAFVDGHGEVSQKEIYDLMMHLSKFYDVGQLNLSTVDQVKGVEALVVARPRKAFSEPDKYKLDQFVMNGGKVLFAIDAIEIRTDSAGIVGLPYDLNLRDLLFRYGVRVNDDMIQDLNSSKVPVKTGPNPNDIELKPWTFHPIINKYSDHIITKNLDALLVKNLGTLDSTKTEGVVKTPLLFTSKYTKVKGQPVGYSPDELRLNTDENYYPQKHKAIAYLLEGNFESLYKGRPAPKGVVSSGRKSDAKNGKVIVMSDADIMISEFDTRAKMPYPLGYNKFTREQYSNKNFISNAFDYLLNDGSIVNVRAKEISYRPLDLFKIDENKEKLYWQIINIAIPLMVLLLFGLIRQLLRKRTYSKFS